MSVRDADLFEALLHRLAVRLEGRPLRVIEWGTGRSTLWYSRFLDHLGVPYRWLALEHDREFFEANVAPGLHRRPRARAERGEALSDDAAEGFAASTGVLAVVYDGGDVRPFLEGREADRLADLDDYVSLPTRMGLACDIAVVDGRKRRRCMLEAAELIGGVGHVVLHDAWRTYYQCAWPAFRSGRRFGDAWWIGSNRATDFEDVLPWHAFDRHAEPS
jgi:hypothetical protein